MYLLSLLKHKKIILFEPRHVYILSLHNTFFSYTASPRNVPPPPVNIYISAES